MVREQVMRTMRVVVVLLVIVLAWMPVQAQPRPIKIAFLSSLSGPFAFWGINARDGMKMAVAEVNEAGGVLGRTLELVERDDRNNPAEGITEFRALVEREGIVASGGMISSDVAIAVAGEAERLRIPYFLTMAGSDAILKRNSRFTFRTCLSAAPMYVEGIANLIRYRKYTRIGVIVADYAWGHSIREAFARLAPSLGIESQIEVAPVGASDFTPYLRKLQALNPQLLMIAGHPPGNPTIVRQAAELGMTAQAVGSVLPPQLMVQRAGDATYYRFIDYSCVDFDDPTFRRLAAKFHGAYNRYFDNSAFSGYVTVKMVADAVRRTNSVNPQALADAIRAGRFVQRGYGWPLSYNEWGEMKEARIVFFSIDRGEAPGGINPGAGWHQNWQFRSPPVQMYVPSK